MVYVLSQEGKPLMPTNRHGKVRHLLNSGKAKVVKKTPFTIQLLFETTTYTQPITLSVDAGSKTVGLVLPRTTKNFMLPRCHYAPTWLTSFQQKGSTDEPEEIGSATENRGF